MLVAQSRPTLCIPVYCSPPGSFVHGILQAIILEWVAISFSGAPVRQIRIRCLKSKGVPRPLHLYQSVPLLCKTLLIARVCNCEPFRPIALLILTYLAYAQRAFLQERLNSSHFISLVTPKYKRHKIVFKLPAFPGPCNSALLCKSRLSPVSQLKSSAPS